MPGNLISVDFDFFCAHPADGMAARLPDGRLITDTWLAGPPSAPNESKGDYVRDLEWDTRIRMAAARRIPLGDLFGVHPHLGATAPDDFTARLAERAHIAGAPLHVADSHLHALTACTRLHASGGPVTVINFDAHHDLGYSQDAVDYEYRDGAPPTCESWLLRALNDGLADQAVIVYPDWVDPAEHEPDPTEFCAQLADRVTVTTWSDWTAASPAPVHAGEVFVARSSWWSPPWCDSEMVALVNGLCQAGCQLAGVADDALSCRTHEPLTVPAVAA